jgi:hypothetical protein
MNRDVRRVVDHGNGVATRTEMLAAVPRHLIDHAVRSGQLVRMFPRVYVDRRRTGEPWVRARAAVRYAGPDAALSHLTALGVWRLPGGDLAGPVHVLVPWHRRPRASQGVVVHRRVGFAADLPDVVARGGLPTCRVERCAVDSWPLLARDVGRAAVMGAVGDRLTTPERLLEAIGGNLVLPARAELLRLVNLLARGCRSELELWGYDRVFTGANMPVVERNVPVRLDDRTVYLDVYCRAARVNFELDGAKWHSSAVQRERDARRDAALAALGIMVVRFTHDQLVRQPELVRVQIRAIIATRLASVPG